MILGGKLYGKKGGLFRKLLISYILIVIMNVLAGFIMYSRTITVTQNESDSVCKSELEKMRDAIDSRIREVDNISASISLNSKVKNLYLLRKPLSNADYFEIMDLKREMSTYSLTNDFVYDIMIYLKDSNILVSWVNITTRSEELYNSYYKYEDLDFEDWKTLMFGQNGNYSVLASMPIYSNNNKIDIITYVRPSLLNPYLPSDKGIVINLLKDSYIKKYLKNNYIDDGGWAYVSDNTGKVITYINNTPMEEIPVLSDIQTFETGKERINVAGNEYVCFHTKSSYNNWSYVMAVPTNIIAKRANYVKKIYIYITALELLAGLLFAWLMAHRNSKPVKAMMRNIIGFFERNNIIQRDQEKEETGNEYDFLESTVQKIVADNLQFKKYMKAQMPLFKAAFIEKLINDRGQGSTEGLEALFTHIRGDISISGFVIAIIQIDRFSLELSPEILKQLDVARSFVNKICEETIRNNGLIHNSDDDKTVIIYFCEHKATKIVKEFDTKIQKIIQTLALKYNINVYAGISDVCHNLEGLRDLYMEALQVLEYMQVKKLKCRFWFKDLPPSAEIFYYPIDVEINLINLTKVGKKEEVMVILDEIYENNFIKANPVIEITQQIFYELKGTILKIEGYIRTNFDEIEIPQSLDIINKFDVHSSIEEKFKYLRHLYEQFCDTINNSKSLYDEKLMNNIIKHINDNYSDADFTLESIAVKFNMLESYLYNYFKNHTGETFTAYIEKIRINEAKQLLLETRMKVGEISQAVGYYNQNTFFKAFKRECSISPSTFRNMHRKISSG